MIGFKQIKPANLTMAVRSRGISSYRSISMLSNIISKNSMYKTKLESQTRPVGINGLAPHKQSIMNQYRNYSVISEECKAKHYDYKDIKQLVKNPSSDVMIVDVREPVEYQEGHIPGAINIPFKSNPGALGLSEEDFEENFGFEKPDPNRELVFYCLAGIRSTAAEDLARTFGYKKRGNYVGSYEDWVSNEISKNQPQLHSNPSSNA